MKTVIIMLLFIVMSCGKESSPEGRSQIRDSKLQEQLDSLKIENMQIKEDLDLIIEKLNIKKK